MARYLLRQILVFLCFFLPTLSGFTQNLSQEADLIFKAASPGVVQVLCLSKDSQKKYVIGSGFQIAEKGYLATNYHVISEALLRPESFDIHVLNHQGQKQGANIVDVDIVHDLAILKIEKPLTYTLKMGTSQLDKGKRIFSMGNPEDVGMMIIDGASNGYMDKAIYQKVLTSLPLNPGMSGGPSLNMDGEVLGVNVMTSGNSLSFLVPVEFLSVLWKKVEEQGDILSEKWFNRLQDQLIKHEKEYFVAMLKKEWSTQLFGQFRVPTEVATEVSCWGEPAAPSKYWIKSSYLMCAMKDQIYINHSSDAHSLTIQYAITRSKDYAPFRFYRLNKEYFTRMFDFELGSVEESDAGNFECRTDILQVGKQPFWVSTCTRRLKRFDKLYDTDMRFASLNSMTEMLIGHLTLGAMTEETSKEFIKHFLKDIQWVKD